MTTIPVTYAIGTEGVDQALADMRKLSAEQERAADLQRDIAAAERAAYAEDRARSAQRITSARAEAQARAEALKSAMGYAGKNGAASVVGRVDLISDSLKAVSRDIDAVAGSASAGFAKWASDALGVASALGTGGLLGGVAALSAGVGAVVAVYSQWKEEADKSYKASVVAITAERERFEKLIEYSGSALAAQKQKSVEDLHQIAIARQGAVVAIDAEIAIQRAKKATATNASDYAREARALDELASKRVLALAKSEAAEKDWLKKRNLAISREAASAEIAAETEKNERIKAALEKRRAVNRDYNTWIREENKRNQDYNSLLARLASQDAMSDFNKAVARNQSVENAFKAAEGALIDARANTNIAIREMELKAKQERVRISYDERVEIVRNLADLASERDIIALDKRKRELDDSVKTKALTRDEADALWVIEQQLYQSRQQARDKDLEQTIASMQKQAAAQRMVARDAGVAAVATELMRHEAQAWGVTMSLLTPIVNEFTGAMRQLGDVNRDNWQDFVMQGEELPRILARKAQAILANIAAEAAGKSFFESAEAIRETALGVGLMFVPGMQGQAAGHIASAALHVGAANAYAAIGGGAAAGAIAIGAARGDSAGSLIGLTKEEREERDRKRGGDGPRGSGGSMGGSGNSRGRQDSGQTVFNITMEYGAFALAPEDPRRIARAFSSGERIARRDGFARLNG